MNLISRCWLCLGLLCLLAYCADGKVHVITASGLTWTPANITIAVGDSIQFSGLGNGAHIPVAMISGFDCGSSNEDHSLWVPPSAGSSFLVGPFIAEMSFPYKCLPHCEFGMIGTVKVSSVVDPTSSSSSTPTTTLPTQIVSTTTIVNITAISSQEGFRWSPSDVLIHVGDSIRFRKLGDGFHQVVATQKLGQCDQSDELPSIISCLAGDECIVGPFASPQTINFKCIPHCSAGMIGTITVQNNIFEVAAASTNEGFRWRPDTVTILSGDYIRFSGLENGFHQAVALSSLDCSTASERSDIFSCLSGNECTVGPFTNTGDIPFKCIPHCSSGMVGVIRVVPEGSQLNTTNSSLPFGGDGGDDDYYWVTVHGGLMSVAWMALVPLSIAIARYGKSIGVWWFRLHAVLGLMIIAVTTAGFIIIEVKYPVDYDDHVILGLIVFIGMYLQVILGGAIDLLYKPDRKSTPWHDIVHWIFGLILLIISWVAIPLGFEYYSDDRYGGEHAIQGSFIAYGVAAFFIIVCFVILEIWKQFFASKPAE